MSVDSINLVTLLPVLILQLVFSLFCIYKVATESVKYLPKWAWIILSLNTVGAILFLILGRGDE